MIYRGVPQKLNVILFLDIEFFKYFFRVLHEASSSSMLVHSGTPVYVKT
jgi:hypothetical protein